MKQFFLILSVIFLSNAYCYARENHISDTTIVEYEICGKDTVFYKTNSDNRRAWTCGLKRYENEFFSKHHKTYNNTIDRNYIYRAFYDDKNILLQSMPI